ncbi:BglG family transcription antiterminator [Lachnospiraceae bacterium 54-53]
MDKKIFQLERILFDSKGPVTSALIAELLEISTRTVKRKIWILDGILKENGAFVVSNKFGYTIEIENQEKFDVFWKKQIKVINDLSINDEVSLKIIELLLTNSYITQDEISLKVFISRGTINKYIKEVKLILEKEKIILSNRPHYGYYLIADEIDVRNYMVKLFFKEDNFDSVLLNSFLNFPAFYKEFIQILDKLGYPEHEVKRQNLMKYIIVIINRNLHHNYIETLESQIYISGKSQSLAVKIKELIQSFYGLVLNQNDLVYISYLLGNYFNPRETNGIYDVDFFEKLLDVFYKEINDVYQQDFSKDETLRRGLMQHLINSYSRLYINAELGNFFVSLIKSQYIEAYNYAVLCGNILRESYDIHVGEGDLAYIAMHFCAAMERMESGNKYKAIIVCESGIGMAEMFKARLKNQISSLEVDSVTSIKNLEETDLSDILLIISSVPIPKIINKPFILVNPLLLDKDIEKIKEYLSDYRNMNDYKKLFSKELFFPQLYVRNKKELLDQVCDELIKKNIIHPGNKKEILNREELSSTEVNRYVAIPHCIIESGNKTTFTVITLKNPIEWGRGEARLVFIGVIARNSTLNKKIFPLLYKLTMDTQKVESLSNTVDFDEFIQKLFNDLPIDYCESKI